MKRITQVFLGFARRPEDSSDIAFKKLLILIVALSCSTCGLVWSAMYFAVFGYGLTMILPLSFAVIVGAAIIISDRIADHRPLIYAQLFCITWISAFIQWSIGSMDQSGLVIAWCFLGPIGALIFLSHRQAVGWMAMFLGIVVISAAFEPALLGYPLTVSDPTRILFYCMNLGVPTSIVFAASAWFVHTIQQARADAQHKSEELQVALTALHDTQARLIDAAKMASLGQLTAGIAHEIKNPLNFVNNFSALSVELVEEIEEACAVNKGLSFTDLREEFDALKFNARQIAKHGKRADTIVNAMMEHARVGSMRQRMSVDLNEVVEQNVRLAYQSLKSGLAEVDIVLEETYDDALEPVEIVPAEVGRVVINLLNNAFDAVQMRSKATEAAYTPTVTVSTRHVDRGQEAGQQEPTRRYVEICIEDNGPGISEDIKDKIFEPFFTTKPTGSGTGLGLSMSYDIVTKGHDGRLRVESEPGSGATFIIELPIPGAGRDHLS